MKYRAHVYQAGVQIAIVDVDLNYKFTNFNSYLAATLGGAPEDFCDCGLDCYAKYRWRLRRVTLPDAETSRSTSV